MFWKLLFVLTAVTLLGACAPSARPPDPPPGYWSRVDELGTYAPEGGITVYHPYPPSDPGFGRDPWGSSPYHPGFLGYYVDPFYFSRYYYTVPVIPPGGGVTPRPPPPAKPPPPPRPPVTPRPQPPRAVGPVQRQPSPPSPRVREDAKRPARP
jgi:hypothetical protein